MDLAGRVIVYSLLGCPHCMRAKNMLLELGIPYTEVRLDMYPDKVRQDLIQRTGLGTVPQIFFNAHYIGGANDLYKLVHDNKLQLDKLIGELRLQPPPPDAPQLPDPSTALQPSDSADFACQPDQALELVAKVKASGIIKDHRKGLFVYRKTFSGKEFTDWIIMEMMLVRTRGVEIGQELLDKHFFVRLKGSEDFLDEDVYYRMLEDCTFTALNASSFFTCDPRDASEVVYDIRERILQMHEAFVSKDGKTVDYKGIRNSQEFENFKQMTLELQRVKIEACNPKHRLSFFINIYNALAIHGNVISGPPANLWQRYKFFNSVKYLIGGYEYSLQAIENGVLRSNRKGVGMLRKPFTPQDPRLAVALERHEPLIHFALVCGAKSCPPLKTFSAIEVLDQLRLAAERFLESPEALKVHASTNKIYLSKIFKWYRVDFGSTDEEVLQWIHSHMRDGAKKDYIKRLLDEGRFSVKYQKYDWSSNAK